jgi:hypothetical protein
VSPAETKEVMVMTVWPSVAALAPGRAGSPNLNHRLRKDHANLGGVVDSGQRALGADADDVEGAFLGVRRHAGQAQQDAGQHRTPPDPPRHAGTIPHES